jgi:hypothetical protein
MTPGPISGIVVSDRAAWIRRMLASLKALPVETAELRLICRDRLGDVERILDALMAWLRAHPSRLDREI